MTPQQILALLSVIADQRLAIESYAAENAELREQLDDSSAQTHTVPSELLTDNGKEPEHAVQ